MIIDCYTHFWDSPEQLGRCIPPVADQAQSPLALSGARRHLAAAEPVQATIVLGFSSQHLGANIPNDRVASYAGDHPDCIIAFAGIDPSDPQQAMNELRRCTDELGMKGLGVAPAAQGFHPTDSQAMKLYAEATTLGLPIIFHTGPYLAAQTMLEYARPMLLDEIAREFPELRIVIAHMGYPWIDETIVLLGKHQHVYTEISWILSRPWEAFRAMVSAHQSHVMDKILFGSGFPVATAGECIEQLYSINHLGQGTNLPSVPREQLRQIVERDALACLGVAHPAASLSPNESSAILAP